MMDAMEKAVEGAFHGFFVFVFFKSHIVPGVLNVTQIYHKYLCLVMSSMARIIPMK